MKDETAGASWLDRAARAGNAQAQFLLAQLYLAGTGVEKNTKSALNLFTLAAKSGRAEWQYVKTGLETDDLIEITSGVARGDTILVEGHLTLAHAAPVRVSLKK